MKAIIHIHVCFLQKLNCTKCIDKFVIIKNIQIAKIKIIFSQIFCKYLHFLFKVIDSKLFVIYMMLR